MSGTGGPGTSRPVRRRPERRRDGGPRLGVVAAVAVGGAAGALARFVLSSLGGWPLTTLAVNAVGCAAIGVLAVLVTHRWPEHWWVRPLFGPGFLGGFTTFSAYAVDVGRLARDGRWLVAASYLVATPVIAVLAVWAGAVLTRRALGVGRG
ncbi:MAG: CrcB family protein [Kineosporiaceae bacterium]|nr:CrcB family protein [Kineosporiaceae bacterium]